MHHRLLFEVPCVCRLCKMPIFTDYEMEMPKAEGWLHIEVYFMQFM